MTLLRRPPLPIVVAVVWAAVGLLWLADAAGRDLPAWLDRAAVAAALLATTALAGRAVLRVARGGRAGRALLVLLALSLVLCFAGLDHEVGGRDLGLTGLAGLGHRRRGRPSRPAHHPGGGRGLDRRPPAAGSELRLYRLDPDPPPWTGRRAFRPEEALLRSPEMAPAGGDGTIRYGAPDQWSLFKAYLQPGRYRVRLATGAPAGRVEVRDRANRVLAEGSFEGEAVVELEIAAREKCFLYVHLPAGSRLAGVAMRRISPGSPGP